MNIKLLLQLSMFGLIMAFATVSLIPEKAEPVFWLVIFIFCAYVIARVCNGNYFLHGLLLSIINSVWITAVHLCFFSTYVAHHSSMAKMTNNMGYLSIHPRLAMLCLGLPFGAAFGLVQGLFAFIAAKIIGAKAPAI